MSEVVKWTENKRVCCPERMTCSRVLCRLRPDLWYNQTLGYIIIITMMIFQLPIFWCPLRTWCPTHTALYIYIRKGLHTWAKASWPLRDEVIVVYLTTHAGCWGVGYVRWQVHSCFSQSMYQMLEKWGRWRDLSDCDEAPNKIITAKQLVLEQISETAKLVEYIRSGLVSNKP